MFILTSLLPGLAVFSNNIFRGNRAERSCGAISVHSAYADRANPYSGAGHIEFSTFLTNRAKSGHGGAVCTMGIKVRGSHFKRNRASLSGGAIFAANVSFIEYSTFDSNFAKELGGAVYLAEVPSRSRPLIIDYCNFTANQAFDSGGAAFSEASLVVAHSFMEDNNATYGGAIGCDGEILVLRVINSSLSDNHATISGGAVWLGGLVTTYSFENSSFVRNYCWRSGGAVHLFAPFTQNPTRFSNTLFLANLLLNDATDPDGTDVTLNSSIAIFDNVTVLSVLITDWSESRFSTARANFTNTLFLADPREYLTMQGATVSILLVNCSYINESISSDNTEDFQKEKRSALRLINRHGYSPKPLLKRIAPFGEQLPIGEIVSIPYTDSSVIACSVGRFFSNTTSAGIHCQPCAQGQYNFNGTNNRCFDCPYRIGCVDIRSNIQYEVSKGYQPAPPQRPQRILKCKMHMSGLEGLTPVPHRDTHHDDHDHDHDHESPSGEAPPEDGHEAHQRRFAQADYDDDLMEHGYHILSALPKLRSSTRHIVPRPQIKFNVLSSTPVASDGADIVAFLKKFTILPFLQMMIISITKTRNMRMSSTEKTKITHPACRPHVARSANPLLVI
jgi:predicted outer membrane repeat protein